MYDKPMLSLEQAQAAVGAMIADYNKDPNRRKVDMAVVDDAGNLLAYARMDRCGSSSSDSPQAREVFLKSPSWKNAAPIFEYAKALSRCSTMTCL